MRGAGDQSGVVLDPARLVAAALDAFPSAVDGPHGLGHWARTLETGLRLAARTGADPLVVQAFAILHDCRRRGGNDPGHGARAAALAAELGPDVLPFDHARLSLLIEACEGHETGEVASDITIGTCWDADRLDRPSRTRGLTTCTGAAADSVIIGWARFRALEGHVPARVHEEWGVDVTAATVDRLRRRGGADRAG